MGIGIYPPPSSGFSMPNWVEISTTVPTSGSQVSFTSLPAYNYYKITFSQLMPAASYTSYRFNIDSNASTTAFQYIAHENGGTTTFNASVSNNTWAYQTPGAGGGTLAAGEFIYSNLDKTYNGFFSVPSTSGSSALIFKGVYNINTVISSLQFQINGTTWSGSNTGRIRLLGAN